MGTGPLVTIGERIIRRLQKAAPVLGMGGLLLGSLGCEVDSFLDPSVVGRWEYTPTTVPILERLEIIEEQPDQYVQTTSIMPDDLVPEASAYEIGPGDGLMVEIFDFYAPDVPAQFQRVVDGQGLINIPQIGKVNLMGLTVEQSQDRIRRILREQGLIEDALVTVQVLSRRQATYSIFGAVPGVGRYQIPEPDYRLLDALTEAGGAPPSVQKIFVIRQVPLTEKARRGRGAEPADRTQESEASAERENGEEDGEDLTDLIEELTQPQQEDQPEDQERPEQQPNQPERRSDSPGASGAFAAGASSPGQDGVVRRVAPLPDNVRERRIASNQGRAPIVDLVQNDQGQRERGGGDSGPQGPDAEPGREGSWVFLNGRWVRVSRDEQAGEQRQGEQGTEELLEGAESISEQESKGELLTQRVIEVPVKPLLQGSSEHNMVIRPGDVIRVPGPEQGFVYVAGRGVARPGVYSLPSVGKLTLTKAIFSAGGLSQVGIPTRVDLTRMVGENRQATIRLNLRAIMEGTEPDVFLKRDDVVNVGTNFWAQPLAIIRNGFRASYGFGFLLDRNFGRDVFGPPPVSRGGGGNPFF